MNGEIYYMKPSERDIKILDELVAHICLLTERNGIVTEKLNLDYYEFEVLKGKVQESACIIPIVLFESNLVRTFGTQGVCHQSPYRHQSGNRLSLGT